MKGRYTLPVLVSVSVVLAAGIVATGGLLYRNQRDNCRTRAERKLAAVADLKVSELLAWRKERLADANVFYKNSAFSALVRRSIERPQDLPLQEELRTWIGHFQANEGYNRVVLFDAAGNKWMMVSETGEPLSTLTHQKVREALRSGQLTFADFYRNEYSRKVYLRLFVPILDGPSGGRPLGVLMLRMDPEAWLYPFIQLWPTPNETAETLLVRREGKEAVFLNELEFQKNTALALRVSLDNTNLPSVKAALGQEGIVEGVDYRAVPVLAAIRAVPDSPWFLVAKMDAVEVYAPMQEWLGLTLLFVGVLLFGVAASVGFVWRQQHAALYRQKYEVEHKYRNLFESSRDALMTVEPPSWKFTAGNPAMLEMFRLKNAPELAALAPWDISPERQPDGRDSVEKVKEMLETAMREGSHFFEWTHKRMDGQEFPATVLLTRMEQAGKAIVQATVRDITVQKRAEEALRTSERRHRLFADNVTDMIWTMDLTGRFTYFSPSIRQVLGYEPDEPVGWSVERLITPRSLDVAHETFAEGAARLKAGKPPSPKTLELEHFRKDGLCTWLEVTISRMYDESGKAIAFQGVSRDVTERRRIANELRAAKEAAEAANRAKSEFLANMSHEIRTPMTAILGYADLMLDENVGRTTREHVAVIKRNGEHLLGLISGILDLSKIETGKLQIEPTRCSPVQVVAEVASTMRPQAAAKQLKLNTELIQPLPETVLTDPLRLRQILVNLLGNAIKFTDQGEVRLAVRLSKGTAPLRFDVTDTGIGMNEEQIGKLFQPFSQGDGSSTRKFGGTGLGLYISKRLAEALGGAIEVRSEPGKGSTFSLTIDPGPLEGTHMTQNAQEALLDRRPSATATTPDKIALHGRILVAEDGLDNQRLIAMLLRNAGAQVSTVENGQLAVEAVLAAREAGEPFDLILMDMQMPVMDGYEATRQLRMRGYTGPIVALTAHAMAEDCRKCLDAGCNDYLPKPFDRQKLRAAVALWLSRASGDGPSPQDDAVFCGSPGGDALS